MTINIPHYNPPGNRGDEQVRSLAGIRGDEQVRSLAGIRGMNMGYATSLPPGFRGGLRGGERKSGVTTCFS